MTQRRSLLVMVTLLASACGAAPEPTDLPPALPTAGVTPAAATAAQTPSAPQPPPLPAQAGVRYRDEVAGLALDLPESWVIFDSTPRELAIFQSYPLDKYGGGETLEAADTKCDLAIWPSGSTWTEWPPRSGRTAPLTSSRKAA